MNTTNQEWADRQDRTPEARREYEYERLCAWALNEIYQAMERKGLSKADLARSLGTSRANITQAFSGARNVTLRTLSDLAWACGVRVCVKVEPLRTGEFISSPAIVLKLPRRVVNIVQEPGLKSSTCNEMDLMVVGSK